MTKEDNPELGRIFASKDHEYPFYFDGEQFVALPFPEIRLDQIRSNGDYHTMPTFIRLSIEKTYNYCHHLSNECQRLINRNHELNNEYKRKLSSKEQELKDSALLYQNVVNTLQTKQQECEAKNEALGISKRDNDKLFKLLKERDTELSSLRAERDKLKAELKTTEEALADKDRKLYNNDLASLRAENERLKIDASHHAYNCDIVKRERDKAENENISLRKRCEDLEGLLSEALASITPGENVSLCVDIRKLLSQ